MCVGAFSSAVFSKCMMTSGMNETLRFILALLIGTVVAAVFGWLIGIPVLRLPCYRNTGIRRDHQERN